MDNLTYHIDSYDNNIEENNFKQSTLEAAIDKIPFDIDFEIWIRHNKIAFLLSIVLGGLHFFYPRSFPIFLIYLLLPFGVLYSIKACKTLLSLSIFFSLTIGSILFYITDSRKYHFIDPTSCIAIALLFAALIIGLILCIYKFNLKKQLKNISPIMFGIIALLIIIYGYRLACHANFIFDSSQSIKHEKPVKYAKIHWIKGQGRYSRGTRYARAFYIKIDNWPVNEKELLLPPSDNKEQESITPQKLKTIKVTRELYYKVPKPQQGIFSDEIFHCYADIYVHKGFLKAPWYNIDIMDRTEEVNKKMEELLFLLDKLTENP